VDDKIAFDPEDSPDLADMTFSDLSGDRKKAIYNYNFVVRRLPEMPIEDLRSMFSRLNRNVVALNPQELRHATYWGEFITTVEKIADDDRWSSFGIFTPNDVRRMLDIEFVSEIVVAFLHGPQNKKGRLEEWYQAYEKEFPQKNEVVAAFNTVISELAACIPQLKKTRWRKKSDFYSLFLVLAAHASILPFSRDGRHQLREVLMRFGHDVEAYLANPAVEGASELVKNYASGVQRAASDLANRRDRAEALRALLNDLIETERLAADESLGV
jgi:hypothetical protein